MLGLAIGLVYGQYYAGFTISLMACPFVMLSAACYQDLHHEPSLQMPSATIFPVYRVNRDKAHLEQDNMGVLAGFTALFIVLVWGLATTLVVYPVDVGLTIIGFVKVRTILSSSSFCMCCLPSTVCPETNKGSSGL